MIGSWRVPLIVTSHFTMYQGTFWSKKLNEKKKLTGRPSPTVFCKMDLKFLKSASENVLINYEHRY